MPCETCGPRRVTHEVIFSDGQTFETCDVCADDARGMLGVKVIRTLTYADLVAPAHGTLPLFPFFIVPGTIREVFA